MGGVVMSTPLSGSGLRSSLRPKFRDFVEVDEPGRRLFPNLHNRYSGRIVMVVVQLLRGRTPPTRAVQETVAKFQVDPEVVWKLIIELEGVEVGTPLPPELVVEKVAVPIRCRPRFRDHCDIDALGLKYFPKMDPMGRAKLVMRIIQMLRYDKSARDTALKFAVLWRVNVDSIWSLLLELEAVREGEICPTDEVRDAQLLMDPNLGNPYALVNADAVAGEFFPDTDVFHGGSAVLRAVSGIRDEVSPVEICQDVAEDKGVPVAEVWKLLQHFGYVKGALPRELE